MFDEFFAKAASLKEKRKAFATATIVYAEAPISGNTGNKAIITADGEVFGWLAGGCSQPIIVDEAVKSLRNGKPVLIKLSPDPDNKYSYLKTFRMSCHSGGSIEVYIEPIMPALQILILGKSAIAQALARLSKAMNYRVTVLAPEATKDMFPEADNFYKKFQPDKANIFAEGTYAIVSTQGEHDEEALEALMKYDLPYLAFVASRKKAGAIVKYLVERGYSEEQVNQIKAPAGIDIRAKKPEEVALSILAEVIQNLHKPDDASSEDKILPDSQEFTSDPVCGMKVDMGNAYYKSAYKGETFYFCCVSCQHSFDKDPEKYVS